MDSHSRKDAGVTYQGKPRTCGFRFSAVDGVVLVLGALLGVAGWHYLGQVGLLAPFVVGHFFLFCNVFRVRRKLELVWSALFLLNVAAWIYADSSDVWWFGGAQMLVTVAVIACEMTSAQYHGIFARRINRRIDDYLAGKA